ncbi:Asp-tRNA(Asn)/Glu-tRNA(Gln) amidotransferase subunit GatC [Candidatus Saccharibacteria bacterium]|nr:Asp-tRNA(Asn)/Glu-tRNA(Gln) amidotransferase subunit GatC [Candidatus Saccharibacteria bacterium]MBH2007211.1 Asp-tRNA(Asn)/Glu-tRNA(Gln) amidotransferase subunit GatC [Candidatus Saccharibacteria bacterium]
MTTISTDDVRALAQLSALRLSDDEATKLTSDLERILSYFELLGELDTEGVEPTYYGMDQTNVSRSDVIAEREVAREALTGLSEGGVVAEQFKVPKVL